MKIIEALKLTKSLQVKADDLRKKIANHSAYLSIETPVYKEQSIQVREWLQAHSDILQEIAKLSTNISRTNLATSVTIFLGEKKVTKSITEWIIRRRLLANLDLQAWQSLTDRNLHEGQVPSSSGGPTTPVTIVRCYNAAERDNFITLYKSEPSTIDSSLEVVNATTDLVE